MTLNEPASVGHVLIVDDDPGIRQMLSRYLAREGFGVSQAENGEQALTYLRGGGAADLILLDLRMPVMNGWAFRAEQRADPALARIPVIILAGADAERFHELGAAAAFEKPARMSELIPWVRRLCGKGGSVGDDGGSG